MPGRNKKFTTKQIKYFAAREERIEVFKKEFPETLDEIATRHEDTSEGTSRYVAKYNQIINNAKNEALTDEKRMKLLKENLRLLNKLKNEMDGLRPIYSMITDIRKTREEIALNLDVNRPQLMDLVYHGGKHLPLWMGDLGETLPSRAGCLKDDSLPENGELIAAYVKDMWILAEVKSVDEDNRITIRDVDDDGEGFVRISTDQLILLPLYRVDPKRHPYAIFDQNCVVLALYPQTTCFYKGIVESPPSTADDSYLITFEDEEYEGGYAPAVNVSQRFVLNYRNKPVDTSYEHVEASDSSETDEETPEPIPQPEPIRRKFKMRVSDEISDNEEQTSGEEAGEEHAESELVEDEEEEPMFEDEESSANDADEDAEKEQNEVEESQQSSDEDENIEGSISRQASMEKTPAAVSESSDEGSEELGNADWQQLESSQSASKSESSTSNSSTANVEESEDAVDSSETDSSDSNVSEEMVVE
uniref:SGF29 C-terminal domain-containing protein n=1 Tax=Panagrolaimus sp. JU765 TaxID=591449 RepID=A0AC34PV80_9BILA